MNDDEDYKVKDAPTPKSWFEEMRDEPIFLIMTIGAILILVYVIAHPSVLSDYISNCSGRIDC